MPSWHAKPKDALEHAIEEALKDLDLSGDPSVEAVVGMSYEELTGHAMQAIATLIYGNELKPDDPTTLLQIYCLAFVVGTKYGEKRAVQ